MAEIIEKYTAEGEFTPEYRKEIIRNLYRCKFNEMFKTLTAEYNGKHKQEVLRTAYDVARVIVVKFFGDEGLMIANQMENTLTSPES